MDNPAAIDWSKIDTVLLDMDGTLLDLGFDNWFWREVIPLHYGATRGMTAPQAREAIEPRFSAVRGTIQWYCIDHWSRELDLDIAALKRSTASRASYLPGAEEFLQGVKARGKRCVLVTNAHPLTLAIKNERVGLQVHFDACYSTHAFNVPKEDARFWPQLQALEPFSPERTLFVDDSLPVLDAARRFGIGWLRAVRCPDTQMPAQDTGSYVGVDRVIDLL